MLISPDNLILLLVASDIGYIRGRNVREITFDGQLKVGQYRAHDFFGDGSFYLLDVPGVSHTTSSLTLTNTALHQSRAVFNQFHLSIQQRKY